MEVSFHFRTSPHTGSSQFGSPLAASTQCEFPSPSGSLEKSSANSSCNQSGESSQQEAPAANSLPGEVGVEAQNNRFRDAMITVAGARNTELVRSRDPILLREGEPPMRRRRLSEGNHNLVPHMTLTEALKVVGLPYYTVRAQWDNEEDVSLVFPVSSGDRDSNTFAIQEEEDNAEGDQSNETEQDEDKEREQVEDDDKAGSRINSDMEAVDD